MENFLKELIEEFLKKSLQDFITDTLNNFRTISWEYSFIIGGIRRRNSGEIQEKINGGICEATLGKIPEEYVKVFRKEFWQNFLMQSL